MESLDDVTSTLLFDMDKLTSEIFSILENKFLFGCYDNPNTLKTNNNNILLSHSAGKVRILSIDGDNGDSSLTHLQSSLRTKSGDPDAQIADFFDVVAGSGSGGLLAALLFTRGDDGRPLCSAEEAVNLVHDRRHRKRSGFSSPTSVFRRIFRRSSEKKKKKSEVEKMLGDLTLKDTLKSVLIPCYDLSTRAPFLFSRVDALEMDGCDFSMADVCMATSADRKVERAVEIMSVDQQTRIQAVGGEVAGMNNPTAAAITHVLNNKQEFPFCNSVEDLLVVSIGNTDHPPGTSDMVDEAVSMAFGECRATNYVRIQAAKNKSEEKLEWFGGEAVKEQERRKNSILPTVIFKQLPMHSPRTSSSSTTFSSMSPS